MGMHSNGPVTESDAEVGISKTCRNLKQVPEGGGEGTCMRLYRITSWGVHASDDRLEKGDSGGFALLLTH